MRSTDVRPRLLPILLAVSAAALAVAVAPAGLEASVRAPARLAAKGQRDLWATINVCDTAAKPDTVGIRGSMPGLARWSRLSMRFRVQYLGQADGKWHDVDEGADSGWKEFGRMRGHVVEAGQDFEFQPPANGGTHHLRGVVRFR